MLECPGQCFPHNSSITSDLETSVRFFSKYGFVAKFRCLLVQKPDPGVFQKGKGGNSSLYSTDKA